jgi:uncharacterized glyoxalase superfamily protein PhnB
LLADSLRAYRVAMPIREGFHTVTPYLTTHDLDGLLSFMKRALGAIETLRDRGGAGGDHVELRVGDSMIMVGGLTNASASPSTAMLFLYVDDPDAYYRAAVEAGASSIMPPTDAPDGRRCGVADVAGNRWFFGRPPI